MQLVLISRLVIIAWKWLAILQSTRFHFPLLYFLWPCSSSHWGSLRAKESELVFTTGFGSLRWAKNKLYLLGSWNLVQFKLEFWHQKWLKMIEFWQRGKKQKKKYYYTSVYVAYTLQKFRQIKYFTKELYWNQFDEKFSQWGKFSEISTLWEIHSHSFLA